MADSSDQPTFHLFSNLPAELRLHVWRLSCIPRVVTVTWDNATERYRLVATAQPAVLQVNSESRSEALRIYSCFFNPTPVYFAPDLDTLYIARNRYLGYSHPVRDIRFNLPFATSIVRSLAVDHVNPTERKEWETYSKWCLFKSFPQLEEAYLVLGGLERSAAPEIEKARRGAAQNQTLELVQPRGSKESAEKEMEDFVESWIYDLVVNSGFGEKFDLEDQVHKNKFLSTILNARRDERWKQLWKCREAHLTTLGSESEWWTNDRRTNLGWVDEPDGKLYRTKSGVWYRRNIKTTASTSN